MTHFEFVAVAAALIYALVIGKLASGISTALQSNRFYWIHAIWMAVLMMVCVVQWWAIWDLRMTEWTPVRFLWLLMLPGLLLIRSSLLVGADPDGIESYETYFYQIRTRFFALGILTGCQILLGPWILSEVPLSTFLPAHAQGLIVLAIAVAGLSFSRPSIQGAVALVSILAPVLGFALL